MLLSTKQFRHYTLALLLGSGKPVSADEIVEKLNCSGPTLTRALKDLRETYDAEIRYSKSTHSYQLAQAGTLTPKVLRRLKYAITTHMAIKSHEEHIASHVILDKEKKRSISLSLRMSVIRKIDRVVNQLEISRSEAVEMLVDRYIGQMTQSINAPIPSINAPIPSINAPIPSINPQAPSISPPTKSANRRSSSK